MISCKSLLLPTGSKAARLIVCEQHGSWAVRMRRELPSAGPRLEEARSLAEAWERLREAPASFVVAELKAGTAGDLAGRLARLRWDFPLAQAAVVAPRYLATYEPLMREAGAVAFVCSPRRLGLLVGAAVRHCAAGPQVAASWREQVWNELPWKAE